MDFINNYLLSLILFLARSGLFEAFVVALYRGLPVAGIFLGVVAQNCCLQVSFYYCLPLDMLRVAGRDA